MEGSMVQIHIITRENRHLYEREMLEQHRLRHECYIVERKWEGLQDRGGLEYDQFDDDDTVYLLSMDDGRVIGGSRMYPTTKPHVLSAVCPQLANVKGIPTGPNVWEWTRLYVAKERRGDGRFGATTIAGYIWAGGLEFALAEGIRELSMQFEVFWFPRFQLHGWKIKPLGLPTLIKNDWWIGASLPVTDDIIDSTRACYGITGPVLVRRGLAQPTLRIAA
jgi:acyl-homoserine lactone synthase